MNTNSGYYIVDLKSLDLTDEQAEKIGAAIQDVVRRELAQLDALGTAAGSNTIGSGLGGGLFGYIANSYKL